MSTALARVRRVSISLGTVPRSAHRVKGSAMTARGRDRGRGHGRESLGGRGYALDRQLPLGGYGYVPDSQLLTLGRGPIPGHQLPSSFG